MTDGINYYEQGEVFSVTIPYINSFGEVFVKRRPALIVSHNEYNSKYNSLVVCCITSNIRNWKESVSLDSLAFIYGGLPLKSEVRVDQLYTIHKSDTRKKFGKIKKELFQESVIKLRILLKQAL